MIIELINERIKDFIDNPISKRFIPRLDEIEKICHELLKEKDIEISNDEWSRKIDINESIKIVYEFLLTIDSQLAGQYLNIIHCVDENNEPMFIIKDKSTAEHPINGVLKNGKTFFYYENTINDLFSIIHEVFHLFNRCIIEDELGNQESSMLRDEYTEMISIVSESLLGEYLVTNGIINQNDFNKRKKYRMIGAKDGAYGTIVECNLIRIFIEKNCITEEDVMNIYNNFENPRIFNAILRNIIYGYGILMPIDFKYVKALNLSKKILSSPTIVEDFIKLNNIIGDVNSKDEDVKQILR